MSIGGRACRRQGNTGPESDLVERNEVICRVGLMWGTA